MSYENGLHRVKIDKGYVKFPMGFWNKLDVNCMKIQFSK